MEIRIKNEQGPFLFVTPDVNVISGFLYDAVLMWAYGVNITLEEGGAPDDGLAITRNIINNTFDGIMGKVYNNQINHFCNIPHFKMESY